MRFNKEYIQEYFDLKTPCQVSAINPCFDCLDISSNYDEPLRKDIIYVCDVYVTVQKTATALPFTVDLLRADFSDTTLSYTAYHYDFTSSTTESTTVFIPAVVFQKIQVQHGTSTADFKVFRTGFECYLEAPYSDLNF